MRKDAFVAIVRLLVKSLAIVRASIFTFSYKIPLEELNTAQSRTHTADSKRRPLVGKPNAAVLSHEGVRNCCVVSFSKAI